MTTQIWNRMGHFNVQRLNSMSTGGSIKTLEFCCILFCLLLFCIYLDKTLSSPDWSGFPLLPRLTLNLGLPLIKLIVQKRYKSNCITKCRGIKLDPYLSLWTKLNSKGIKDPNVRHNTLNLKEVTGTGNNFLSRIPEVEELGAPWN